VCFVFLQCLNYVQLVWQEIIVENHQDSNTELYNGAVEALYTLIGRYVSCSKLNILYVFEFNFCERKLVHLVVTYIHRYILGAELLY
jgi:hypothetical protein